MRSLQHFTIALPTASVVFALSLAVACGGPASTVHEISPGQERPSRSPESVEMFRNAPPSNRAFEARYVMDINRTTSEAEAISRYRDLGGTLGCDAVVVYTADHPVRKQTPKDDEALVLEKDGSLVWRVAGGTTPNRQAFFIQAKSKTIVLDGPTVALCLVYSK